MWGTAGELGGGICEKSYAVALDLLGKREAPNPRPWLGGRSDEKKELEDKLGAAKDEECEARRKRTHFINEWGTQDNSGSQGNKRSIIPNSQTWTKSWKTRKQNYGSTTRNEEGN